MKSTSGVIKHHQFNQWSAHWGVLGTRGRKWESLHFQIAKSSRLNFFWGMTRGSLQVIKGGNFKTNPWGKVFPRTMLRIRWIRSDWICNWGGFAVGCRFCRPEVRDKGINDG